jgi:effector-binding domain-containing protein/carbon monoxide dehydrogenase subunit G
MKILKILLILVGVFILIALILGIVGPKSYDVNRSALVAGTPEQVWPYVSNLKNMAQWSPWAEKDTAMTVEYTGTDGAVGSMSSWSGNKEVGKGSQTLSVLEPNSKVESTLVFLEPMAGQSTAYTHLKDTTGGTYVTWGIKGENGFVGRIFGSILNMDKMMAPDFERGLAKLTDLVASLPKTQAPTFDVLTGEYAGGKFLGIKGTMGFDKISAFYEKNIPLVMTACEKAGGKLAGAPSGLYFNWDTKTSTTEMAAALPFNGEVKAPTGMDVINVPAAKSLTINYVGGYNGLGNAHNTMDAYIASNKLEHVAPVIEEYLSGPATEPDSMKWVTKIVYFVK